jgi:hypothetical protein
MDLHGTISTIGYKGFWEVAGRSSDFRALGYFVGRRVKRLLEVVHHK